MSEQPEEKVLKISPEQAERFVKFLESAAADYRKEFGIPMQVTEFFYSLQHSNNKRSKAFMESLVDKRSANEMVLFQEFLYDFIESLDQGDAEEGGPDGKGGQENQAQSPEGSEGPEGKQEGSGREGTERVQADCRPEESQEGQASQKDGAGPRGSSGNKKPKKGRKNRK